MLTNSGSGRKEKPGSHEERIAIGLPIVRRTAFRLARRLPPNVDVEDLIGAGTEGLLRALQTYDETQYPNFEPYAKACIRGAILDELRANDSLTRYGRDRQKGINKAIHALHNELGREPTESEIASRLNIALDEFQRISGELVRRPMLTFVEPIEPDTVESDGPTPSAVLDRQELRARLMSAIERLPEKSQQVLALYYQEECTQLEIGRILGVTNSRASQILSESIAQLRTLLEEPDDYTHRFNHSRRRAINQ
jgi:RNA polymerase sigma factor FliA